MNLPERLPIERIEDYHTHYLGRMADGRLFWAYHTFVFDKPYSSLEPGENWQQFRKEYALIHTFSNQGDYLATTAWYAGLTANADQRQMEAKIEGWMAALGEVVFEDIAVTLFQTQIDGITFGLVVDEEHELISLEPSSTISFGEPWNGEYFT